MNNIFIVFIFLDGSASIGRDLVRGKDISHRIGLPILTSRCGSSGASNCHKTCWSNPMYITGHAEASGW
jgi:hypothetical protein